MIDPKTGSKLVTLNLADGTERHLKKLSPSDWLKLGNSLRSIRKEQRRQEMIEEKAEAEAVRTALQKIDSTPVKLSDLETFLNTPEGQYTAILIALARDNPAILKDPDTGEAEMMALGITPADWQWIMMDLCNMEYTPPLPASPSGASPGATSQTTSTTSDSPSTSAPLTT
jgi:hypothetical protein